MKELSIEEKAKAYDEALEGIQEILSSGQDSIKMSRLQLRLQGIFPELKESKDERIRNFLISKMKEVGNVWKEYSAKDIIAWLEKQGEQINLIEVLKHYPKETELYCPLYGRLWLAEVDEKNGIIVCYKHHLENGCTRAILEQEDTISFYSNGTTGLPDCTVSKDCMLFLYEKQVEQKPAEWHREDEQNLNACLGYIPDEFLRRWLTDIISVKYYKIDDKVEPKFHEGEWLCENEPNNYARFIQILETVNVQGKERYRISRDIHNDEDIVEFDFVEKYYHKFDIQDAKAGDVLADGNLPFIFKRIDSMQRTYAYCGINGHGNFSAETESELGEWTWMQDIKPATKEQRDFLFAKMKEAGYEWDAEKRVLKKQKEN